MSAPPPPPPPAGVHPPLGVPVAPGVPPPLPPGAAVPPPPAVGMVPPPPHGTAVVPPPPPAVLPPPPVVLGAPPPVVMGAPPPPPVMGAPPPPIVPPVVPVSIPPPNMSVPPPNFVLNRVPASRPSNMVLFTNVPSHMNSKRLKEWSYPCGSVQSIVVIPSEEQKDTEEQQPIENDSPPIELPRLALVSMSHADGALKLVCAYNSIRPNLPPDVNKMTAHLLPMDANIAMPPPLMDEEATSVLGDKLQKGLAVEKQEEEATTSTKDEQQQVSSSTENKLDVNRAAAAAGGGAYDPDEDPLNAPAVLEAVALFRKQLSGLQSTQKKKRVQAVNQKLAIALKEARLRVERERQGPPPPPLPNTTTPPPLNEDNNALPKESGRRGVSNLPAWMTKDRETEAAEQARALADEAPPVQPQGQQPEGPPRKKPKLDLTPRDPLESDVMFAPIAEVHRGVLKAFIASQIAEYLGEEESTLIEFCLSHVTDQKSTKALLEELKLVLEEDAPVFVKSLYEKVNEMQ